MVGVYKITSPSKKVYIGQSRNIKIRWGKYGGILLKKHPGLYESFYKYGKENHSFEICHELPNDVCQVVLNVYEKFYINTYREAGFFILNLKKSTNISVMSQKEKERRESRKLNIVDINSRLPGNSRLTAIRRVGERKADCICSCGKNCLVGVFKMMSGHTLSCGCLNIEKNKKYFTKYFPSIREIHHCWMGMIDRCYNPKNSRYKNYGQRGIVVCDEWRYNYQAFLDWAIVSGWAKGLQLDKDIIPKKLNVPALLYSPETCCFVTPKVNANNRTNCVYHEYNGEKLSLMQICNNEGLKYEAVRHHLRHKGKNIYEAISIVKSMEQ